MLCGYPIEAIADNWLHDCLFKILEDIHAGLWLKKRGLHWPECIPEKWRDQLKGRPGLKKRLRSYQIAFGKIDLSQKAKVSAALQQQNDIEGLLSCNSNCDSLQNLPTAIQRPIKNLFEFAFGLLSELGIRDAQYKIIWKGTHKHICPFCGYEFFSFPGSPREDEDHFLAESRYTFAAVNLKNLVPMGTRCNRSYKLAQDVLFAPDGTRRRAFNPFGKNKTSICLENSKPFGANDGRLPKWEIDFVPASPECETWDQIFHIRERYCDDILNPQFSEWLRPFVNWWKEDIIVETITETVLLEGLARYLHHLVLMEMTGIDFLRVPVFSMLLKHCTHGDQRLIKFLLLLLRA